MKTLETTDNRLVGIAIGQVFDGTWYVQTTDLLPDNEKSESIEEGLSYESHAYAIAMMYRNKYQMAFYNWSKG